MQNGYMTIVFQVQRQNFTHQPHLDHFGKPSARKISGDEAVRNWDPTDPDKNNPWREYLKNQSTQTNTKPTTGNNQTQDNNTQNNSNTQNTGGNTQNKNNNVNNTQTTTDPDKKPSEPIKNEQITQNKENVDTTNNQDVNNPSKA